tara:strand:+ start:488 stop:778 length:291 start_codon:yes stop_codon:yes gene_type:complete
MNLYEKYDCMFLNEYYNQNQTQPLNEDEDSDLIPKIAELIYSLLDINPPSPEFSFDGPRFRPNPTIQSGGGDFGPIDGNYGGRSRFRPYANVPYGK